MALEKHHKVGKSVRIMDDSRAHGTVGKIVAINSKANGNWIVVTVGSGKQAVRHSRRPSQLQAV